ncbi:MAG TPA: exosortase/archaeosortase family protein [Fimbriiglobus sp.]|nr:exosortase/archaeosortase family protein [Fimbriiglobus sp.]
MSNTPNTPPSPRFPVGLLVAAAAVIGWAFLPTILWMVDKWSSDPQYSHGFLVPLFSGYLLWRAAQAGKLTPGTPSALLAGLVLVVALGMRWLAGGLLFQQLDCLALLLSLAGLAVAAGGVKLAKVAAPAILFLIFMIPLPYDVERNVGGPLKEVATLASTFLLQTLGYPAVAEGHLILIDEVRLGVVDACSGLKMLMTFAAFAVGAVLLTDRTRFEKLMILLGIVPIAVVTNVLRITATGVAHTITHEKSTLDFLHDLHGWLMMPVGLALLGLQLWCLSRLVVQPTTPENGFAPVRPAFQY